MIRLELVITRWEDGLFKSIDRITADSIDSLEEQFERVIDEIRTKTSKEAEDKYKIAEDDDIPF